MENKLSSNAISTFKDQFALADYKGYSVKIRRRNSDQFEFRIKFGNLYLTSDPITTMKLCRAAAEKLIDLINDERIEDNGEKE